MDHAITRRQADPIEAFVPLDSDPSPRKGGRKKGTPNRPKQVEGGDSADAPVPPSEGFLCACGMRTCPMSADLARELVRASRDKILESQGEVMSAIALADTLYLAARFDGYCSLACWRAKRAAG